MPGAPSAIRGWGSAGHSAGRGHSDPLKPLGLIVPRNRRPSGSSSPAPPPHAAAGRDNDQRPAAPAQHRLQPGPSSGWSAQQSPSPSGATRCQGAGPSPSASCSPEVQGQPPIFATAAAPLPESRETAQYLLPAPQGTRDQVSALPAPSAALPHRPARAHQTCPEPGRWREAGGPVVGTGAGTPAPSHMRSRSPAGVRSGRGGGGTGTGGPIPEARPWPRPDRGRGPRAG